MPYMWGRLPDGTAFHANVAAPRKQRCEFCGRLDHVRLCDGPGRVSAEALDLFVTNKPSTTCDAKMCGDCAFPGGGGADIDFCPRCLLQPTEMPMHNDDLKHFASDEALRGAGADIDFCPGCLLQPTEMPMHNDDLKHFASDEALRGAGYHFSRCGFCRGCGHPIEWWRTPHARVMPVCRAGENAPPRPHFSVCPAADQFRKEREQLAREVETPQEGRQRVEDYVSGRCAAVQCRKSITTDKLMCLDHWRLVPGPLQKAVWAQYRRCQEKGIHPLRDKAYMAARQAAINFVAKKEGVRIA